MTEVSTLSGVQQKFDNILQTMNKAILDAQHSLDVQNKMKVTIAFDVGNMNILKSPDFVPSQKEICQTTYYELKKRVLNRISTSKTDTECLICLTFRFGNDYFSPPVGTYKIEPNNSYDLPAGTSVGKLIMGSTEGNMGVYYLTNLQIRDKANSLLRELRTTMGPTHESKEVSIKAME